MPIGGCEVVLAAPAQESVGDLILRACRRHWPGETCYFQDAEDEANVYRFDDPWVWLNGTASKEFFVYRNEAAVKAWEDGPTSGNVNTMFHFILGPVSRSERDLIDVAVAFDRPTREVKAFLADLANTFLSAQAGGRAKEAA